ncbi:uncharacterized protein LOC132639499 [Lycium barbarum]|uniref:uncharacterized protein LOC132639499 n=1 Tax=Lycium barbarum TaxID=112863 RepID=UPI00293F3358|nr:uncharacterized protein LOC132639499 [Lycium barbarum]
MKSLKIALSKWSRDTFGDLFKQSNIRDHIFKIKEQLFEEDSSEINRMVLQRARAEFKKYLHFEEEFWRQKAGIQWYSEGDRNTTYFHSLVKGRRKKFQLNRIQKADGEWLENADQRVTQDQNVALCAMTTLEEVLDAVFALSGDSAYGPDGFSDLRPISLSNSINKVISRVMHDKLESILPSLILVNQSGFFKGRNIIENVFLTQELVDDIRKRGKPANVIIKLDMAKAYDRVSWRYLAQVLRKMGFAKV